MVKKVLIGLGGFVVILVAALAVAPVIFKDEIKQAIDEQLEVSVNADVQYDIDKFSVSFFTNFPNLTAAIKDLAVIGREPFAGETLFAVGELAIELNIWKLLGSEMTVEGIYLDQPEIFIKVLEDGTANYDIALSPGEEEPAAEEEAGDFRFAIEYWRLTNGHIIYDDATLPTYVELTGVNHTGGGNFTLSVFDLTTNTEAFVTRLSYDGISYLEKRSINLALILNMDLEKMKFTFRDNQASINDFSFGLDGWLAMPAEDIDMDLTFTSRKNTFKSLISLIPAIYAKEFDGLETSGEVVFEGAVKGTYNDTSIPAYHLNLGVTDGMFQYPDLPKAVKNVQVAMKINCDDGNIDHTAVDISKFHLEFGEEPMDGYFKLDNLVDYPIDLEFNTSINLANLNELLPMQGLDISGTVEAHIRANGRYDSINSTIPKFDGTISYRDGAVRYADVPAPIDQINLSAAFENTTGKLNDTRFSMPDFAMEIEGSPVSGNLTIDNFDNLHWQAELGGVLNFDKLFPVIDKLYPMPGTTLSGSIKTKFSSKGTMQDLDQENYAALETAGEAIFNNFLYKDSVSLPQGFAINSGSFSFDPRQITVADLKTRSGSSDFNLDGRITNYLAYVFNDELLSGQMGLTSQLINVNEFMTESGEEEVVEEETDYSVIEVPNNINFVFNANIDQIRYDKITLNEATGKILVRDGELRLDKLSTKTMGGTITFNGLYSTTDLAKPRYSMGLDVKEVGIAEAYQAMDIVQALAPIARDVSGNASSTFSMSGFLQPDMMPDLASLTGQGKILIAESSLKDSKFVSGLTNFIKGENQSLTLKDIKMAVSIANGKLKVQPFDLKLNNTQANIGGSTGLDGSLDYAVKMAVPAGQLGTQVNSLLGSLTGSENASETIQLNIGVTGSYNEPKFNLLGSDSKSVVTQQAGNLLKDKTGVDVPLSKEELNKEAIQRARAQANELLAEAQLRADQVKFEAKKNADKLRDEAKKQSDKLLEEAGSNILKKKAAEIAGKKLINEAEVQATKLETEGEKQAEAIMSQARQRADALISKAENN